MKSLKAIETSYRGHRFRSRTEARWAYCLDLLGWHWQYEPEGYDLGAAGFYLPDFLLLTKDTEMRQDGEPLLWLEVKGTTPTEDEHEKLRALVLQSGVDGAFAVGAPTGRNLTLGMNGYCLCEPLGQVFKASLSIGAYSRTKWGRPGWFMECGLEDRDARIAALVSAARFEHGEQPRL